jgi:hypothetical protein
MYEESVVGTDKGEQIMLGLLLDQYQKSPVLIEYIMAFVSEMDLLYKEIENVYLGRFLDNADGVQLDIIGAILGQNRNVSIPRLYFGFAGASGAQKMSDIAIPEDGGVFRSHEDAGFDVSPLDDNTFRRALRAKGLLLNSSTADINLAYKVVITLLNRVPSVLSFVTIGDKQIQLELASATTTAEDLGLINYMSRFFIPTGVEFEISLTI